jgi:Lrp/AsnC family leucine-responsive transcriptional regulator
MNLSSREKRGVDAVDREIIGLLRENGRMPYRDLGAAVGLSANAVADRVRRMSRDGIIARFTILTNPVLLDETLEAIIDVRLAADQDDAGFEAAVSRLPSVLEDVHLTGPTDHQLRVACQDVPDLNKLLRTLKRDCGVSHTDTRVVLHQSLNRRATPAPPSRPSSRT